MYSDMAADMRWALHSTPTTDKEFVWAGPQGTGTCTLRKISMPRVIGNFIIHRIRRQLGYPSAGYREAVQQARRQQILQLADRIKTEDLTGKTIALEAVEIHAPAPQHLVTFDSPPSRKRLPKEIQFRAKKGVTKTNPIKFRNEVKAVTKDVILETTTAKVKQVKPRKPRKPRARKPKTDIVTVQPDLLPVEFVDARLGDRRVIKAIPEAVHGGKIVEGIGQVVIYGPDQTGILVVGEIGVIVVPVDHLEAHLMADDLKEVSDVVEYRKQVYLPR